MRVWYDVCTGKHLRYGAAVAKRLRSMGHEVIMTTRRHPDTLTLAEKLGEKPIIVGSYDPTSLASRLEQGIRRMLRFTEMFGNNPPDAAVSHQSPDMCRVAFGLGIPSIVTSDTPYADAVHRLTIPYSTVLLMSEAMPLSLYRQYGAKRIVRFKGVDEVAWIQGFAPQESFDYPRPLIVVRQLETRAVYAGEKEDLTERVARKLTALGTVLFIPRYERIKRKGMLVADEYVDTAEISAAADLMVGVGGTICREAALQGTPTVAINTLGTIQVNDYLAAKGFPIFTVPPAEVTRVAKKCLARKFDVKEKLAKLENPADKMILLLNDLTSKPAP